MKNEEEKENAKKVKKKAVKRMKRRFHIKKSTMINWSKRMKAKK